MSRKEQMPRRDYDDYAFGFGLKVEWDRSMRRYKLVSTYPNLYYAITGVRYRKLTDIPKDVFIELCESLAKKAAIRCKERGDFQPIG